MRSRSSVVLPVVLLLALLFGPTPPAWAQQQCPAGSRPATASDAAVQDGRIAVGACYDPNDTSIGQTAEQARQYLRGILCSPDADNYGGLGPDGTIKGLDGKFAVCAAKFLRTARDSGVNVCVREGARSVDKQNEYVRRGVLACRRGAMCEHPRGIAIDVNVQPNPKACASYQRLHSAAPQFGLIFYLGCRDAYHFVPARGNSNCTGGGVIPPQQNEFYDFPQSYPAQSPSSDVSDAIRRALGVQQQLPAQPQLPPQPQLRPQQPLPSQPTLPAQPALPAQPTISSEQTPVSSLINTNQTGVGSTQTNTPTSTQATSTFDLISQYGNLTTSLVDVGTATSIALNANTSDIATLAATRTPTILYASGTLATRGVSAPQTFTSGDLVNSPAPFPRTQQSSFLARLLDTMRNTLLYALNYLKPFGGIPAQQYYVDSHFAL